MFGKIIWLSVFQLTGSRCEDLILLHFFLRMLNNMSLLKPHKTCLRYNDQLKEITITSRNLATNTNFIVRKMSSNIPNHNFNILCKIGFWNKTEVVEYGADYMEPASPVSRVARLVRPLGKMVNFISKKISDYMRPSQPSLTNLGQPIKQAGPLPFNPLQPGVAFL